MYLFTVVLNYPTYHRTWYYCYALAALRPMRKPADRWTSLGLSRAPTCSPPRHPLLPVHVPHSHVITDSMTPGPSRAETFLTGSRVIHSAAAQTSLSSRRAVMIRRELGETRDRDSGPAGAGISPRTCCCPHTKWQFMAPKTRVRLARGVPGGGSPLLLLSLPPLLLLGRRRRRPAAVAVTVTCDCNRRRLLATAGDCWRLAGGCWRLLATSWRLLAAAGGCWRLAGGCWRLLATAGGCWRLLAAAGGCWRVLATAGDCWRLLATAGGCWRLLATAGDCWRLLAAAGGCWRLLAAAGD